MLKIGVLGCGVLGTYHAKKYAKRGVLAGLYDPRFDVVRGLAGEIKTRACRTIQEFWDLGCDAISIASPTSTHAELAKEALSRGIHVLIEKPVTSNLASATELARFAREKNLICMVGHVERFNPAFRKAEQMLAAPKFAEIHRLAPFKARSLDVDVVLDLMIHDLDLLLALVKSPVREIRAVGIPVVTDKVDIANARIEFEDGCVANLTCSRVSNKAQRKFRIFGQNTYVSLDLGEAVAEIARLTKVLGVVPNLDREQINMEKGDALQDEIDHFIECVTHKKTPITSIDKILPVMQLAERILAEMKRVP